MENTKISISYNGSTMVFPISPESFSIPYSINHEKVNINGLGEILLKGNPELRSVGWNSFFPAQYYDFCQVSEGDLMQPNAYVLILTLLAAQKKTVTLNVSDFLSLPVVVSSFSPGMEERGKDVAYSITFTEDKSVDTPSVKKQTAKRPTKEVKSHLYKWKKGDTWKKVAKKETGDSKNASKLKKANQKRADQAVKKYKKAHPNQKTIKEEVALVGEKVLIK